MSRNILVLVAMILPALACADDNLQKHKDQGGNAGDRVLPRITVTINPEGRVNAVLADKVPSLPTCGTPISLLVKIINQGFITASLEAKLLEDSASGAELIFRPEPLRGIPEETRTLSVVSTRPGDTDLTIAFRVETPDLDQSGRDRIHFVMHCGDRVPK